MTAPTTPIYLVSLEQDKARRDAFKQRFSGTWAAVTHLPAVDGRKLDAASYFMHAKGSLQAGRGIMSPAEVGCALSHLAALDAFLASGQKQALILEDDVLGDDADIERVIELAAQLADHDVLICGGQEGLSHRKYQFGKQGMSPQHYTLAPFSYRYIFRTCCYIVSRPAAERIIATQRKGLRVADDWGAFFDNSDIQMHLINALSHPEDLSSSLIEAERIDVSKSRGKKFSSLSERFRNRARRIARKIRIAYLLACGYRPAR